MKDWNNCTGDSFDRDLEEDNMNDNIKYKYVGGEKEVTGEEMLQSFIENEPENLDENAKKLFDTIMKIIDERDVLQQKLHIVEGEEIEELEL